MEKIDNILIEYIRDRMGNSKTEQELKFWQKMARQIYKQQKKQAKIKAKS